MKTFIKFIDGVLIALLAFTVCLSFVCKETIMQKEYVKKQLASSEIYTSLTKEIKESILSDYRNSSVYNEVLSAYLEPLLDEAVKKKTVQKEVEAMVDDLYAGKEMSVKGTYFTEDYNDSINSYLKKNNLNVINADMLSPFISKAVQVAISHVDMTKYTNRIAQQFKIIKDHIQIIFMASSVSLAVLIILSMIIVKRKIRFFGWTMLLTSLLHLLSPMLMSAYMSYAHLSFNKEYLTDFFMLMKNKVTQPVMIAGVVYVILGFTFIYLSRKNKEPETEVNNF